MYLKIVVLVGFLSVVSVLCEASTPIIPVSFSEAGCSRPLVTAKSEHFTCVNQWIEETFSTLNCSIQFVESVLPDRKLRLLNEGELDLVTGLSKTPQRIPMFLFSRAIHHTLFGIFGSRETQKRPVTSLCDDAMRSSHLIVPDGYYISDEMDAVLNDKSCYKSLQKTPMTGVKALEMLIAGRAELIILPENYLASLKKAELETANLFKHPIEIYGEPVHIALSKATISQDFLATLNTTLTPANLNSLGMCLAGKSR